MWITHKVHMWGDILNVGPVLLLLLGVAYPWQNPRRPRGLLHWPRFEFRPNRELIFNWV